ncbi:MAG: 6-bladed beta-propeller [Methanosarcina sp.]|nr:6-bladed beta-propeller [Methanosarcina sp.]
MKKIRPHLVPPLFICLLLAGLSLTPFQGQEHFVNERKKILKELKVWMEKNYPDKCKPLYLNRTIPLESASKSPEILFKGVTTLSWSTSGHLILPDSILNFIYIMDRHGNITRKVGKPGQGPGELMQPIKAFSGDGLLQVLELGNMRIQSFDENGNHLNSFRLFRFYTSMERTNDGLFFGAPAFHQTSTGLVDLLTDKGELLATFGDCLNYSSDNKNFNLDNSIVISVSDAGDLWVAFKHYPIIRRYSKRGELLTEFHIDHPIMNRQAAANRKGEVLLTNQRAQARIIVINAIRSFENNIYILRTHPCLEIMALDLNGNISAIYYWSEDLSYSSLDFLLRREGERIEFYVLNLESQKIDIFNHLREISS